MSMILTFPLQDVMLHRSLQANRKAKRRLSNVENVSRVPRVQEANAFACPR